MPRLNRLEARDGAAKLSLRFRLAPAVSWGRMIVASWLFALGGKLAGVSVDTEVER